MTTISTKQIESDLSEAMKAGKPEYVAPRAILVSWRRPRTLSTKEWMERQAQLRPNNAKEKQ